MDGEFIFLTFSGYLVHTSQLMYMALFLSDSKELDPDHTTTLPPAPF